MIKNKSQLLLAKYLLYAMLNFVFVSTQIFGQDVKYFKISAGVPDIPSYTTAERDTELSSPETGMAIYNTSTNRIEIYDGSDWISLQTPDDFDADWTVSGIDMYSSVSGNIGIGDNTPDSKLTVSGDILIEEGGNLRLQRPDGTGSHSLFYRDANNDLIIDNVSSSDENIILKNSTGDLDLIINSGKLGIGYNTPTVPLSFGTAYGDKIGLYDNGTLLFGMGTQANLLQIYSGAVNTRIGMGYGNSSSFTETMSIIGDKVGIGISSNLLARLHVRDNALDATKKRALLVQGISSQTSGEYYGLVGQIVPTASSTGANFYGIHGQGLTNATGGNASILSGVRSTVVHQGPGTIDYAIGAYFGGPANDGSGTITNAYSLYLTSPTDGTNNYALFQGGGANNYFSGAVGVGTATITVALDVFGDIEYTGTCTQASDIRLKENFSPLTSAIEKTKGLTGMYFNMKDDPERVHVGVIAQDVQKVLPEAVKIIDEENGYLGVTYNSLITLLIEAVKEQQQQIDYLKELLEQK